MGPSSSAQSADRCVAVLIGINEYTNGIPRLRNAVRDVQRVAQVLRAEHGYRERLLLNEQATLSGLRALFSQLPAEVSADTRLILYFAGHGIAEETDADTAGPQGFLIPQDAKGDDPTTYLPMAEVQALLAKVPCRHLLLLLDCCFAGAFRWSQTRNLRTRPATLYRERYERYLRDPAWQVIASAAADERALDVVVGGKLGRRGTDDENSPFAAVLCQGLHGEADVPTGNQPGDGVIVANELHVYLENRFSQLENQLGRKMQKPLLWSIAGRDKGQFVFLTPGRSLILPSALELNEQNNPYRGLEPYEEKNAALFFGRSEVIEQLQNQVLAQPLTVVSGISGSGKSSVVRAGLLSCLRKASDWVILPLVRPGNLPLSALASVRRMLNGAEAPDLASAIASWRSHNPGKRLLLVIDQLEELVTMGVDPAAQRQFLDEIGGALAGKDGPLHVVMTLRSDFEPHFVELLTPKAGTHVRFLVRPLNRQELRQVIEGPASERVLYFEPATLVDQLVDEVAEMPGALPLLSFTMSELYRTYVRSGRSDRCLAAADYQKLNGVAGALSQRADEIFHSLDTDHQKTLQRVMLRMVSMQAGDVARRRVSLSELRYGDGQPEEARKEQVLNRLKDARLVVSGTDNEGSPYVEPAHDKLVLGWPQLWSFIKQEQETIPLMRLLTQEANTWIRSKSDAGLLWIENSRLPFILELLRSVPERFNALEAEFIRHSESLRQQRENTRLRRRKIAITTLSLTVIILSALSWFLRRAIIQSNDQLLSMYIEQGRQALIDHNKPTDGLLWFHRAQSRGSRDPYLPYLIHTAMLKVDMAQVVLIGHHGTVLSATISPDGRRVATTGEDQTVRLWDASNGSPIAEFNGHRRGVGSAMFSRDGRQLLTASWDGTARIWEVDSGQLSAELKGHADPVSVAEYSPDGRRVVTASDDHTARIWEVSSSRLLAELKGHQAAVNTVSFSSDSRRIVTASNDHTARVWEADSGRLLAELKGHQGPVVSATFSPDTRKILTASNDRFVRIWETDGGRPLFNLNGHEGPVHSALFSPDGHRIVTASGDRTARLWETEGGTQLVELTGHEAKVHGAAFSPDGHRVVTVSDDETVRLWEAKTGRPLAVQRSHRWRIRRATFSPDGRSIVTASDDGTARIWRPREDMLLTRFEGHDAGVNSVSCSPNGQWVVTTSWDQSARVWNIVEGKLRTRLLGHQAHVVAAVFSPDGQRIVTASWDRTAKVWDPENGRLLAELACNETAVHSVSFSPNGQHIITTDEMGEARVWNAHSYNLIAKIIGDEFQINSLQNCQTVKNNIQPNNTRAIQQPIFHDTRGLESLKRRNSASFSPDGRRILTAYGDGIARLWDVDSQRLLMTFQGHGSPSVRLAKMSPDGRIVATASDDGVVMLWSALDGRLLRRLQEHRRSAQNLAFSPDSRYILATTDESIAWTWSTDNGRLLAELRGHRDSIASASFSPDSLRVVTASWDHTAREWEVSSGKPLAEFRGHSAGVSSAVFSPDGSYVLTGSEDRTTRVWDASSESPTPEQLGRLIRCHIADQFEGENSNAIVSRFSPPEECRPPITGAPAPPVGRSQEGE